MDNILNKFTQSTKHAATQMGLASKIAKLNVEIATQKGEKERHIKNIGSKVYAIFGKNKQLDGSVVEEEIRGELSLIDRIDRHIEEVQHEISKLQADFRNLSGSDQIVDATEVKEAEGDPPKT